MSKGPPYVCPECALIFDTIHGLVIHLGKSHEMGEEQRHALLIEEGYIDSKKILKQRIEDLEERNRRLRTVINKGEIDA